MEHNSDVTPSVSKEYSHASLSGETIDRYILDIEIIADNMNGENKLYGTLQISGSEFPVKVEPQGDLRSEVYDSAGGQSIPVTKGQRLVAGKNLNDIFKTTSHLARNKTFTEDDRQTSFLNLVTRLSPSERTRVIDEVADVLRSVSERVTEIEKTTLRQEYARLGYLEDCLPGLNEIAFMNVVPTLRTDSDGGVYLLFTITDLGSGLFLSYKNFDDELDRKRSRKNYPRAG